MPAKVKNFFLSFIFLSTNQFGVAIFRYVYLLNIYNNNNVKNK